MNTIRALVASLLIATCFGSPTGAALWNQNREIVDRGRPPGTLGELIDACRLIVMARVTKAGGPELEGTPPEQRVRRIQHVVVTAVLKGPASVHEGTELAIRQFGGTVSVNGRDVVSDYEMRLLEDGDQVLLFLTPAPKSPDLLDIAFDRDGALWQDAAGSTDLPPGLRQMPELSQLRRAPMTTVLDAIRLHDRRR